MVLFYEETPEELYECTQQELAKRLYKLTKFSSMTTATTLTAYAPSDTIGKPVLRES